MSEIVLELTPSHPLREGAFFGFSSTILVEVRPERAAALFGLAHLDGKIIAGLERVIDRPLVETSHTKYITSRSRKSTTRIIGERNRRPQPLSQTGFRGSPR